MTLVAGAFGLSGLIGSAAPASAAAPVVPLVTAHEYWDHHWFVWLPRHPVYESVEIGSIDAVGNRERAVWVFFTGRHGKSVKLTSGTTGGSWSSSREATTVRSNTNVPGSRDTDRASGCGAQSRTQKHGFDVLLSMDTIP